MQRRIGPFLARLRLAGALSAAIFMTFALVGAQPKPAAAPVNTPKPKEKTDFAEARRAVLKYLAGKSSRPARGTSAIKGDPGVWCFEIYQAAPKKNPKEYLYSWVAEHLVIAERRFLNAKTAVQRLKGVDMVNEACQCAYRQLQDGSLAVQIADAYLMPHLKDAAVDPCSYLSKRHLIETAVSAYAQAKDADKFLAGLQMVLENAPNPNTADAARLRIAVFLDRQGRHEEALDYLKQIDPEGSVRGGRLLIPEVEKKRAEKQRKEEQR